MAEKFVQLITVQYMLMRVHKTHATRRDCL